ncbi:MAG: rhamnogalacturonan acetylesterase, partial [Verrucomicrobiae bacterium]|nr:rhamnogalacturonan acetylesterase [Verrucomicrobiae bacterium]
MKAMHVLSCYLFSVMLTFFTMQISAETNRPCIFIAGDSTAAPSGSYEHMGWGEPFADYFNPQKVDFRNMARGGKSSRTFITEGFWNQILEDLQPGDIVLIQFGHNDLGAINDDNRARGTLPGLGDESEDIQNRLTGRPETVHTYGWYIRKMINDVKQRQARPILLSLTVRNIWGNGRLERRAGKYGSWMYQLAKVADVPFLDLTNRIADRFEELGRKAVEAMYPQDHTHFNAECAEMHASAVLSLLQGLKPNLLK